MLQLVEAVSEGQEAESGPLVLLTALINTLQQDAGFHFVKVGRLLCALTTFAFSRLCTVPVHVVYLSVQCCVLCVSLCVAK